MSPFYQREIIYQNCTFLSIAHLLCYIYAIINNQKTFATGIRKWSRPLMDFPRPKFTTDTEIEQWRTILTEIYTYLCISDSEIRSALVRSGPRPFTVAAKSPWGPETGTATPQRGLLSDVLIDLQVAASHDILKANTWLGAGGIKVQTLDTRVADWLGHSGASFKTDRFEGEFHSFSQQRPRYIYRSFIVFRSASSRGIIKRLDFLLNNPKANWTYVIITDSRKSLKLVTFIVIYHHNTDRIHIHIYS